MKDITLVIVTYGGIDDLVNCLSTLEKTEGEFKILIVDNDSGEGMSIHLDHYIKEHPEMDIKAIYLRKNIGCYPAFSIAMTTVETKYVAYIHQDMYFPSSVWLKQSLESYRDGQMYFFNQYYHSRPEKRSWVQGFLLYSWLMDRETYLKCPIDYNFILYVGDLEHQIRFITMYGKDKWIQSNGCKVVHRGGVIGRSCGRPYLKRILAIDSDRFFKELHPSGVPGQSNMIDWADKLHKEGAAVREIMPLPKDVLRWVTK